MAGKRVIVGSGRTAITFDGALAGQLLVDLQAAIGHEVVDEILTLAGEYRADAESTWPVRTGKSRDALQTDVRLPGGDVVEGVVSTVEYGRFIVSGKVGKKFEVRPRSPLTELRRRIIANKRMDAATIKDALVRGLNRRIGG